MTELLSPAGNLEKLKFALAYGADAVYVGGSHFSLRHWAGDFSLKDIEEAKELVKEAGKKIYVAVNIFADQSQLKSLKEYLKGLNKIKPDALIIADPGVLQIAKEACPDIVIHVSTQANVTNAEAANFWAKQGAKRVTLARELALPQIKEIAANTSIETEVFIHGAMCLSYSGRCWLSQYMTGRDANKGDCSQSCRWNYSLVEEKRPNDFMPVFEDEHGSYILSSKDLCLAEEVPELIAAGVDSFKIEGRMKSIHYVATVTKTYREIIDQALIANKNSDKFIFEDRWRQELEKISHRQYTKGFINNDGQNLQVEGRQSYFKSADFVAVVEKQTKDGCQAKVKNRLLKMEELEVLPPSGDNKETKAQFYDENSQLLDEVHANSTAWFKEKWPVMSLIRKKLSD